MPGMQWPSIAAPLPPNHKKKSVTPGFTDAELLYLEEVLAVVCRLPRWFLLYVVANLYPHHS